MKIKKYYYLLKMFLYQLLEKEPALDRKCIGPHSRSVKTEGFPLGLQKLTVHGVFFGLSGGLSVGLTRIRRCLISWAGLKRTEVKTERRRAAVRPLPSVYYGPIGR